MGQPESGKISKITSLTPGKNGAIRRGTPASVSETKPALKISGIACGCGSCDTETPKQELPPSEPKLTSAISCGCDSCDDEQKEQKADTQPSVSVGAISCSCDSCDDSHESVTSEEKQSLLTSNQKLVLAGIFAIAAEAIDWFSVSEWLAAFFALIAVALSGVTTYKKGWQALRRFDPNMHALMSIAVTGAFLIGQWPEAAMVMVLFNIAEFLESKSLERARNAIQELMTLTPEQALVQQSDNTWKELYINTVGVNQVIRIKPGVRIPLDGTVIRGSSSVDQAPITGESLPAEKNEGDVVYAGTINQQGSFDYRVTATTQNTLLARIIHSVEEAQGKRAPIQRLVDRFARIYTPIILTIAVLVALVPPLFFAAPWFEWLYKALVLLVIGCPCALVLSTPVAIVTALSVAARHGILIKGGHYLELGRKLQVLALDKTGTITTGKPELTDMIPLADTNIAECQQIAVALALHSEHPVSRTIVRAYPETADLLVQNITSLTGAGIQGVIAGETFRLISPKAFAANNALTAQVAQSISQYEAQGKTVVLLVKADTPLALFAVADTIKASSQQAITELHHLHIHTVMLTGDNAHTANRIATQAGIDQVYSNQLPEDKLNQIDTMSKQQIVGMVGDGINDAPALARASIGFAMGGMGSDTAIETADIALMDDDLHKVPLFVRLSQATWRNILQNITVALGIKAGFLLATLLGFGTLWMAVFADMGTSLLVVANAMRLLRFK